MPQARLIEGPRAPLFITFAVTIGFAVKPVFAQAVDRADLVRCAGMSTDKRKLACFESLLDEPRRSGADTPSTDSEPAASLAPVVEPPPVVEEAGIAATVPAESTAGTAQPADDFGGEYVRDAEDDDQKTVTATVNEVTRDRLNRLSFHFANGQVWRQLEARHFQYPKDQSFDVVISRGMLGDYQLRVGGEGRMTRIKRLK